MRRNILAALASAALFAPALAGAASYEIDTSHTGAQFAVKHLMVSTVRGDFNKTSGSVSFDEKNPAKSTVEAVIDVNTINTRDEKRDGHLKSPDFFDAAKYPTITFKSTKVEAAGKGKLKVSGDLTIHGVTKPVVLAVEGPTQEIKDPWGNTRRAISATTKINRKDFGLGANMPNAAIGEEVSIIIDSELVKKADAAPAAEAAKTEAKPAADAKAPEAKPADKK